HGGEERQRQAAAGLAIGAGLGTAGLQPPRDAMRDQPGHGGATGRGGGEDLAEEDPEGHQRREEPGVPAGLDLAEGLRESRRGEDVGEGELAVLQELLSEGGDRTAKASE